MSDEYKTYRANAEGYDGDKLRVEGETFTTNIPQGSWMDLLDENGNVVERPDHKPAEDIALQADIDALAAASVERLKNALDDKDTAIAEKDTAIADKDARIAELEAKLAAASKAPAAAPAAATGAQPDPGPLDKSIPDLTAYLETVSDVGTIDALIAAEKGGKSRSGAIDALEARKTALQGS